MGKDLSRVLPISAVENIDVVTLEVMGASLFEKINKLRYQLLRSKYTFDKAAYMQTIHNRRGVGDLQALNALLDRVVENADDVTASYKIKVQEIPGEKKSFDNNVVLIKMLGVTRNINTPLDYALSSY